jgi:hypothetical protein
MYGSHQLCPP